MLKALAPVLLGLSAAAPLAAQACSLPAGYRSPSNLELARDADAILIARVVGGELDEGGDPFASTVTIRPVAAIKGQLPSGDIALDGMMLSRDAGAELGVLSNPFEFAEAHPVSYLGGCIRYVFPLGTTALFFLKVGDDGKWAPAQGAFIRWAEDVPDADAPWVQLTRFYLAAASLPEADRVALFEDEREALLARREEPVAQLMAADIARQQASSLDPPAGLPAIEARGGSAIDAALDAMRKAAQADERADTGAGAHTGSVR